MPSTGRQEPHVPFAVTSVVIFIFSSSGLVNVVLMLLTRKNLLLFGQRGVVNPARIGPAAQARLNAMQARMNRQNNRPRDNNNDGDDGEADVGMRRIGANLGDGDALAAAGAGRGEVGDGTKMRRISEEQMEGPGGMISEKNAQKRGSLSGRIRAVVGLSALTGHYSPDGNSQRRPSSAKSKEREESTDDTTSGEQQQQQQHHAHRFGFGFGHRNTTNVTVDNNNQKKRNEEEIGGDTSFVAGGFTTGAFETERSFELGSAHLPSTIHSPTSPTSPYPFYSPHTASYPPPPRSAALAPPSPLPTAAATARGDENSRRELDVVASTGGRETYDSTLYADLPSSSRALHDDYDADLGRRRPREGHGVDEDDGRKLPYHASQDYDGIPEGMSRHLGSAGEYDTDPLAPPLPPPAGLTDLQLAAYQRSGPTTTGEHQRRDMVVDRLQIPDPSSQPEFEYSHASTLRSNFLDLDPSRSNVGAGSSAGVVVPDAEHGHAATTAAAPVATTAPRAISPSSPMHPPAAHLPREHPHYPHSHPAAGSPVAYSIATGEGGVVVVGNPISEGRRGSAVSKVSQSGSVRSRGSAPKSSVDIYDYSVPMKFNPTPPAPPPAPLADSGEVEISRTHSRSPFGSRSRNTSNKSLNKSSSKTSLRKSGSKSAIAADVDPLAPPYHYQRRGSEGTMTTTNEMSLYGSSASPATVSSSKAAPWTSLTTLFSSKGGEGGGRPKRETLEPQPVLDIAPRKSTDRSTKGGRTSSSYGPSPPNSAQSDSRLLSKRSADLAQHRGMVYSQSQSHQHHHQQQQQQQQNWSRASGSSAGGGSASLLAAGRRPSATQTDEEVQMAYRPNTGGSTRSYRSYTFGPPGIASSSSTPSPTPAAAPHHTGEGAAAVHPLTYDEPSLQMRSKGFSDQEIGRAL
ncbi:hypothetical protein FRC17_010884 [Serendipita sp. 399]|nr:hypothetical protein FRC17_010884 [Serendipita sp. 399]